MSLSFNDALALWRATVGANAPGLAVGGGSIVEALGMAFCSADANTNYARDQAAFNVTLTQAQGDFLDAQAADVNVLRNAGNAATGFVTISLPNGKFAASPTTIDAGTVCGTQGASKNAAVTFTTNADAVISAGSNSVVGVPVTCTVTGTVGNVAAGAIYTVSGNYTISNPAPTSGGINADSDSTVRSAAKAALLPKYAPNDIAAAALSIAGVYDVYVADPQDGSGAFAVYWSDPSGAVPGGTLAALTAAVNKVVPAGIKLASVTYAGFTIKNITAVSFTYSAPATILSGSIEPLMQNAIAAYVGALTHGEQPTLFGMAQAANAAVGNVLSDFKVTPATTPTPDFTTGSTTPTQLWRLTGTPGTVITLVRV